MLVTKGKLSLVRVSFKGTGLKDTFMVDVNTAAKFIKELNDGITETDNADGIVATATAKRLGRPSKKSEEKEAAWPTA